jgi:hypothetical protein
MLQRDFLSVVFNGRSYPMSKSQPTFKQMKAALEKGQWDKIPNLISLAAQVAEQSHGRVSVKADGVYYKGVKVENTIAAKISELIDHSKPVAHLLKFMDNLYQQPNVNTVNEIYQWLASGRFALTDDGCFLAYKKVDTDYMDFYTHTVDNHVGQIVTMARKAVDTNRHNTCSHGLHFCSKGYLPNYGGGFSSGNCRIMEVKINPADVVAIPVDYSYTKGRTWRYEVLREVQPDEMIEGQTDTAVMMQPVIEVAKERQALIRQVKALPTVKRLLKKGKLTSASFKKASVARLTGWLHKFTRMDVAPAKSKLFDNPLRFAREAAGLTMGQVARVLAATSKRAIADELKEVYNAERSQSPSQQAIDRVLEAIAKAQGNTTMASSGVSYPRPASKNTGGFSAYTPARDSGGFSADVDDEDEFDGEEDGDDEYPY